MVPDIGKAQHRPANGADGWIRAVTLRMLDGLAGDADLLDELLGRFDLKRSLFDNPFAVVSAAQMASVLEWAAQRLSMTDVGIRLANGQRGLAVTDPVELAIFNAPTLRDAFLFGERHANYFSPAVHFHVDDADERGIVRMHYSFAGGEIIADQATEYGCVLACRNIIDLVGGTPHEVWFRHSRLSAPEIYEANFRAPVRFNMPFDAVFVDEATLDCPIIGQDPQLYEAGKRMAEMRQAETKPLSAHLQAEIERLLPRQQCSYDRVCDNIGFAARTLRRHLAREHTTFKELKNSVRRRIVKQCLDERGMRKVDVARSAGYSDAASIRRNVKRWF